MEKLKDIERMREKIARLEALSPEEAGGKQVQNSKLGAWREHLEKLKIQADINDPIVKKRFEDGKGAIHYMDTSHDFDLTDANESLG